MPPERIETTDRYATHQMPFQGMPARPVNRKLGIEERCEVQLLIFLPVSTVFDMANPYSYDEKYSFNSKDNRLEAGLAGGMGISYTFKNRQEVFSEARLLYSITDRQKHYMTVQVPQYNTTYAIHVGLLVPLSKKISANKIQK